MDVPELEVFLAEEMAAFSARVTPPEVLPEPDETVVEVLPRVWRPQSAYPSDYGRGRLERDCAPEWDFRPADERWE